MRLKEKDAGKKKTNNTMLLTELDAMSIEWNEFEIVHSNAKQLKCPSPSSSRCSSHKFSDSIGTDAHSSEGAFCVSANSVANYLCRSHHFSLTLFHVAATVAAATIYVNNAQQTRSHYTHKRIFRLI